MVIYENKISLVRRFFGTFFLLVAFLILAITLDMSLCLLSGYFESTCQYMEVEHPNMELIKEVFNQKNVKLFRGPFGFGVIFFLIFSVAGTFFGFFNGKHVFLKGQLVLKIYLYGFCVRAKSLATLSKYQEIKLTKETGFTTGRHGEELPGRDVFHVYLMGSEEKLLSAFFDYDEAKSYCDKLSSVTNLPIIQK
ncbi:MAG: hypothetical protein VYD54_00195 [Bdellovibrionota bacterium]|nr:hypothetical protein [Bdellovibrionota bacterium]